ncbi:MAG: ABC transporter ATP-binding protein [Chlorobi bacterium]|nr:ABC transporter ATP-binding protein [Chlorobiota bacterium]
MIQINNVKKSFDKLTVLKGINAHIKKGEIVAITGPSGAGKTTLLQIIGTISNADEGTVLINQTDITKLNPKNLAKFRNEHIGFVFQFHHLLPEFTAIENICMPAFIKGTNRKDAIKRAKELLKFLKLSDRAEHKPNEMSGGEQQRVAVARALINNPSVILADEPSGNLDTENKKTLHQLFFSLRDKFEQTFVIVTHNNELAQMSDRIIKLKDGKIENGK